jgi:hypothetical protein
MTAAPVAAGVMAMATAPTAACAVQRRQQGTSSRRGSKEPTRPLLSHSYFVLCCKFTSVSTFWLQCTNQACPTLC